MCFGFSGAAWTYGLTYPPLPGTSGTYVFSCVHVFRLLRRCVDSWFELPAPRGTSGTYVLSCVHVFRLLGRCVDLGFDLPAPLGLMELMFFVYSCVVGFSGVAWTYRFTYPIPPALMELMFFMCFGLSAWLPGPAGGGPPGASGRQSLPPAPRRVRAAKFTRF